MSCVIWQNLTADILCCRVCVFFRCFRKKKGKYCSYYLSILIFCLLKYNQLNWGVVCLALFLRFVLSDFFFFGRWNQKYLDRFARCFVLLFLQLQGLKSVTRTIRYAKKAVKHRLEIDNDSHKTDCSEFEFVLYKKTKTVLCCPVPQLNVLGTLSVWTKTPNECKRQRREQLSLKQDYSIFHWDDDTNDVTM